MGIGGNRGAVPVLVVALVALAGVSGALFGLATGGYAPRGTTAKFVLGQGATWWGNYVDAPPTADGSDGIWATTSNPAAFGTPDKAGALYHLHGDGTSEKFELPTLNSYPADPALATDGALWFVYTQGDGAEPSVDTGPGLRDAVDFLARRTADGHIQRFPLPSPTPLHVRLTAAGADGTVWYAAYTQHGDVYGRFWPDGHSEVYAPPEGVGAVSGLVPNRDGTVWMATEGQNDVLFLVGPQNPNILARLPVPGSTPFDAIAGPVPAPGSAVWIETGERGAAEVIRTGSVLRTVAGERNSLAQLFAADGADGVWILRQYLRSLDGSDGKSELLHVSADGSVSRHPLALASDRSRYIAVASDGAVWLVSGSIVRRLG